ncbi:MAG: septum formation initiator [Alphaproteobacteria bacterium]|nr:septum formation initiator [Alphaproteobacteria bacterium]
MMSVAIRSTIGGAIACAAVWSAQVGAQPYVVEAETYPVSAVEGPADATVGTIAYIQREAGTRPILFAFNGGPGASSTFLHLGVLGPYRVEVPADPAAALPAVGRLVRSENDLLDTMDIVFLDPPGTGLSTREGADPEQYNSVEGDAMAVAQAVIAWLERHDRRDAPIYILGESYGTIRAAAMLDAFGEMGAQPEIRGVVLLGQALNMIETSQRPDNILSYVVSLPTLAAIACYHGQGAAGCTPEQGALEAANFARGPYLDALFAGQRIDEATRTEVAERLQELTGIAAEYYLANDLRISKEQFRVRLLRRRGLVPGRYDARYTAPLPPEAGDTIGPDAFSAVSDLYAKAMPGYLEQLAIVPDPQAYRVLARFEGAWRYGGTDSPFSDWPFMSSVERAAANDACLRLFVGTGLFDLTTTIGAADYLLAQSELPPERAVSKTYQAGHMFYSDPDERDRFLADLRNFVAADACA